MSNLTICSLWTSIACLQHKCTHALSPTLCAPLPSLLCLPLSQPNASVFTTTHPSELGQHVKQRYYRSFSLSFSHSHTHTHTHTCTYSLSLSLSHTHTHTHSHTHTHAVANSHAHTHAHSYTYSLSLFFVCILPPPLCVV